ncbi:predicted protein [Histoplasma capsulatum H143]|uniref:Uncharacterized protein n=1 Tax=Ajellomyces capsulatus (strain H143) TaxID=544712 RepID=C6HF33_AJECH|nr:predicted protein [Histoplasma capsulatum H143]
MSLEIVSLLLLVTESTPEYGLEDGARSSAFSAFRDGSSLEIAPCDFRIHSPRYPEDCSKIKSPVDQFITQYRPPVDTLSSRGPGSGCLHPNPPRFLRVVLVLHILTAGISRLPTIIRVTGYDREYCQGNERLRKISSIRDSNFYSFLFPSM